MKMQRFLFPAGWLVAAVMLLAMAPLLAGCGAGPTAPGANAADAPAIAMIQASDPGDVGEIRYDGHDRAGFPQPVGAVVEQLAVNTVQLRWTPQYSVHAIISVDGVPVAMPQGSDGYYIDNTIRTPGQHTYQICFCRGTVTGHGVTLTLTLATPGTQSQPGPHEGTHVTDERP